MGERVLIDTGPIVAILSKDDEYHARCADALASLTAPLFTCWPVITEAAWLLRKRPDSLATLFEGFQQGFFSMLPLEADSLHEIYAIMCRYESFGLQVADAALAYLAERENILTIFTTDRRDFSMVRLKQDRLLRIIPDVQ